MKSRSLALCVAVLLVLPCAVPTAEKTSAPAGAVAADLVLRNGKIWTVNKAQPQAEALAVWRDRIIAVGTNADVQRLTGPRTKVIDLHQRRVVPGFHDSHIHLVASG